MKKGLFALVVLATIMAAVPAPDAAADHCYRCANFVRCAPAVTGGKPVCDDSSGSCVFQGLTCSGPHPLIDGDEPFAAAFVVASVERLDDAAQPQPNATQIASLDAAPQQQTTGR